eukprot:TCONS_00036130-protein
MIHHAHPCSMAYQKYIRYLSLALMVPPTTFPATLPFHLQPLVEHLPSHIKNTKHMLTILDSFGPLPSNITIIAADVISLYTNIPDGDGLEATSRHYKQSPHLLHPNAPSPFAIKVLLEHVLKHSNFQFLNSHYIQNNGTSMGGRYAPKYEKLFMADVEAAIHHAHTFLPSTINLAEAQDENFLNVTDLVVEISANKQKPSVPFLASLDILYRTPKDDLTKLLESYFDNETIYTLKDQLFHMFMDKFDTVTLSNHGFNKVVNSTKSLTQHLKQRQKSETTVNDIYIIGLSLAEKTIVNRLAHDILKPSSVTTANNQKLNSKTWLKQIAKNYFNKLQS